MKGNEAKIEHRIEHESMNTRLHEERHIRPYVQTSFAGNFPLLLPQVVQSIIYFLFPSPGSGS